MRALRPPPPGFPISQASHQVLLLFRQAVPHSLLHLSSLLECLPLAALLGYSLRLRLLSLFPHKQIRTNHLRHHLLVAFPPKERLGHAVARPQERLRQPVLTLPNQALSQNNPKFKKATELKVKDTNFSPVTIFLLPVLLFDWLIFMAQDEHRAIHPKYFYAQISEGPSTAAVEDFL